MGPDERALLLEAFDSNWIAPLGPHVDGFERELADYLGGGVYVAALSSGTSALHLALLLAGVEKGDEVICPTLTFAATANAIRYVGASPVFVDADEASWNIDPTLVRTYLAKEARRGRKPSAIISVDLYGQCANYAELRSVANQFGVPIIEDAAEALGATHGTRKAGVLGDFGVLSFNGNKIITTSGGGAVICTSAAAAERARYLSTQARTPARHYEHTEVGFNYRMSNLLAAVGRGQLRALDSRVLARRRVNQSYRELLANLPQLKFQDEAPWGNSTFWLTCVTLEPGRQKLVDKILTACEDDDIEARPLWKPMHLQPVFEGYKCVGGQRSEDLFTRGLCLPSGSSMTDDDIERVCAAIRRACWRSSG